MVDKPTVVQKSPYPIEVEKGTSYYWCQCGQSKKQPSVILLIKAYPLTLSCTEQRKQKKCIFVVANLLPINRFVMEPIQKFKNK